MPTLGPMELAIILVIVVLIFGAGKLPELGSSLGKTFKDFRSATKEVDELKQSISLDSLATPPPAAKRAAPRQPRWRLRRARPPHRKARSSTRRALPLRSTSPARPARTSPRRAKSAVKPEREKEAGL